MDYNNPFELGELLISKADEGRRDRTLTLEEEQRLLAACEGKHRHLKPLITLLIDTGMRRGEAFKLEWKDVDFGTKIITVVASNSKTSSARKIPMLSRLEETLLAFYEVTKPSSPDSLVFGVTTTIKTA